MSFQKSLLNIVVALHCEAKPLISHWRLKKITHLNLPFPLFVNEDKSIQLIVSGVGKIKVAAATTFLYVWSGSFPFACFLNVGIAGSIEFDRGAAILVRKVIEQSTGRAWYPFTAPLKDKKQGTLITYDLPQVYYPAYGMLDMEAAAFFQVASGFVTQEHIHIVKIISDGHETQQKQLNQMNVQQLIADNMAPITEVADYLLTLSANESQLVASSDYLTKFNSVWHFTHSQSLQLQALLRRWKVYFKEMDPFLLFKNEKKPESVIKKLREKLDNHAYRLC